VSRHVGCRYANIDMTAEERERRNITGRARLGA
jgi:hypothetical protein